MVTLNLILDVITYRYVTSRPVEALMLSAQLGSPVPPSPWVVAAVGAAAVLGLALLVFVYL